MPMELKLYQVNKRRDVAADQILITKYALVLTMIDYPCLGQLISPASITIIYKSRNYTKLYYLSNPIKTWGFGVLGFLGFWGHTF